MTKCQCHKCLKVLKIFKKYNKNIILQSNIQDPLHTFDVYIRKGITKPFKKYNKVIIGDITNIVLNFGEYFATF